MRHTLRFNPITHGIAAVVVISCLLMSPADAQSEASQRASEASVLAAVEVPVSIGHALSEGGKVVVTGIAASGATVALTVSVVGLGTSFVVHLSAEAVRDLALASGRTLDAVSVDGGWLLMTDGEAVCFVANEAARSHIHSREIEA